MKAATTGSILLTAGSVFVTQQPADAVAQSRTTVTTLVIPAAAARGLPLPASAAWRLTESPLLAPVVDFIVRAGDAVDPDLNGFSAYHFEHLLQEMFVGLLIETNRPALALGHPQPFTDALAVIVVRCSDPLLTPAAVAQDVRLSLRQLQRVFRERGTTIGRELRRARVEQAIAVLRDQKRDVLSIDRVAEMVGFSSGSSLARAMAAEGHVSPTRAARSLGSGNRNDPELLKPERAA
ncbi:helix-turn-helix transcriptional regulator [Microbacterium murale]|uniref:helix-turn-helix transcriptional regulator n=1 Tax=Microbacterium murale TaxID=1081040 RepID=UPI0027D89C69|nr:helix-turn-helix domain-containing protein [Microbacterium murale]